MPPLSALPHTSPGLPYREAQAPTRTGEVRCKEAVHQQPQRRHALQEQAYKTREYFLRQQQQQNEAAMERQHGLSEWLKDLDHQKKTALRQRRVSGMRSSLERQSILQQSCKIVVNMSRFPSR